MSLQSEVCLWTLLGLIRTIFDATLFKVNANLKQVSNLIQYPLSCVFCKSNINLTPTLLKPPKHTLYTYFSAEKMVCKYRMWTSFRCRGFLLDYC